MRRALLILVAIDVALGAIAACSSFSGASDGSSDASASDAANDASIDDGSVGVDAGSCATFDAAPLVTTGNVTCGDAGSKDIGSDPDNCGGCGRSCFGEACDGTGHCVPEAFVDFPSGTPTPLGLDDASVYYFTTGVPTTVYRSPRAVASHFDAATTVASVSDAETYPYFFGATMDSTDIYATTFVNVEVAPQSATLSLFAPLVPLTASVGYQQLIVADDLRVAYTDGSGFHVRYKDGGATVIDYTTLPGTRDIGVTPDRKSIFFAALTNADAGMTTGPDGGPITSGTLYRWRAAGGLTPMVQFNTPMNANAGLRSKIDADNDFVYFTDDNGSILQLGVDAPAGTAPTVVSQGNARTIGEILADADHVYFTFNTNGAGNDFGIARVSKCGGADLVYVAPDDFPLDYNSTGLVIDSAYVYWGASGGVYRVAK